MVVVDVVEPAERVVSVNYRVGYRHPLGVSAHGRALLAFLPEGAGDASLLSVRQRGVAYTRDELEAGASGVAAPVFDHGGKAVAAVGIVAPTARLPEPESVALRVLRSAREISERLGWRPRRSEISRAERRTRRATVSGSGRRAVGATIPTAATARPVWSNTGAATPD